MLKTILNRPAKQVSLFRSSVHPGATSALIDPKPSNLHRAKTQTEAGRRVQKILRPGQFSLLLRPPVH
jgi:hypothetical protein